MHILMNMFMLWMFGMVIENVWGPKKFLFITLSAVSEPDFARNLRSMHRTWCSIWPIIRR